ncbi:unnamed protein product [Brassicogethes aeneus]|uniref:Uncharacterized protein n=1 Tax=Brassicogethes aeneus TaxID=1431903 RepID=A0A9P0FM52_BRAAE|nr:unnamed protein product [Brassicogethes aeneus]
MFKVFSEWKSKVRRKAKTIEQSRIQTGGGPADSTELNAVEEQLLALTSKIYLGDTEVKEAGVSASASRPEHPRDRYGTQRRGPDGKGNSKEHAAGLESYAFDPPFHNSFWGDLRIS